MKNLITVVFCMLLIVLPGFYKISPAQGYIGVSNPFNMDTMDPHIGVSQGFLLKTTPLDNISNPFILDTLPGKEFYDAQVQGWYIPSTMETGQEYEVSLSMINSGEASWIMKDQIYLGAVGDQDDFVSPQSIRVHLTSNISPGETNTFAMTFKAPSETGLYTTQWRMLKEGHFWFGESFSQEIEVRQRTFIDEWLWQLFE